MKGLMRVSEAPIIKLMLVSFFFSETIPIRGAFILEVEVRSFAIEQACCPRDLIANRFCLQPVQSSEGSPDCSFGLNVTRIDAASVPAAITISSDMTWLNDFLLLVNVLVMNDTLLRDEPIEEVFAKSTAAVSSDFTTIQSFSGNNVTLHLRFRVQCLQNYYASNCSVFCLARDDKTGHFTCDVDGALVCLGGYADTASNCTKSTVTPGLPLAAIAGGTGAGALVLSVLLALTLVAVCVHHRHQHSANVKMNLHHESRGTVEMLDLAKESSTKERCHPLTQSQRTTSRTSNSASVFHLYECIPEDYEIPIKRCPAYDSHAHVDGTTSDNDYVVRSSELQGSLYESVALYEEYSSATAITEEDHSYLKIIP